MRRLPEARQLDGGGSAAASRPCRRSANAEVAWIVSRARSPPAAVRWRAAPRKLATKGALWHARGRLSARCAPRARRKPRSPESSDPPTRRIGRPECHRAPFAANLRPTPRQTASGGVRVNPGLTERRERPAYVDANGERDSPDGEKSPKSEACASLSDPEKMTCDRRSGVFPAGGESARANPSDFGDFSPSGATCRPLALASAIRPNPDLLFPDLLFPDARFPNAC